MKLPESTQMTDGATAVDTTPLCTCARLRMASRAVTQVYDAALQPAGLHATQFTLLLSLHRFGSAPLSQIADRLVMDRTTLTRNLGPLQDAGFVEVVPGADRRVREIRLTPAGVAILESALPLWRSAQEQVRARLGEETFQRLMGDLKTVVTVTRDLA